MIHIACPTCKNDIKTHFQPEIGMPVKCETCQAVLEVTWLYPIRLDYPEEPFTESKPETAHTKNPNPENDGET